jgi:hypothetical protein
MNRQPNLRTLLALAAIASVFVPITQPGPSPITAQTQAHAQTSAKSDGNKAELSLSRETDTDLVKADVNLNLKVKLPEGDTSTRGLIIRIERITVANDKPRLHELPVRDKTEFSTRVVRANTIVVSAWREGRSPLRTSEPLYWRAVLPPDAAPGQTDLQPVTLDWTLELKPVQPAPKGLTAQTLSLPFTLTGNAFNIIALWFDADGKVVKGSYKTMLEAQADLNAKKITSAIIVRANDTDNDPKPVEGITIYSSKVTRGFSPSFLNIWTTGPDDGLIIVQRMSDPKLDFGQLTQAPTDANLYRKFIPMRFSDIGDFSSIDHVKGKGPIFLGKLGGKYFKLQLNEFVLNDKPETEPLLLGATFVVQPDGSANLPGE